MKAFSWTVLIFGVLVADGLLDFVLPAESHPHVLTRVKRTVPKWSFEGKHLFNVELYVRTFRRELGFYPSSQHVTNATLRKADVAVRSLYPPNRRPPIVSIVVVDDNQMAAFKQDNEQPWQGPGNWRQSSHSYTVVDVKVGEEDTEIERIKSENPVVGIRENATWQMEVNHYTGRGNYQQLPMDALDEIVKNTVHAAFETEAAQHANQPILPDKPQSFDEYQLTGNTHSQNNSKPNEWHEGSRTSRFQKNTLRCLHNVPAHRYRPNTCWCGGRLNNVYPPQ